MNRDNGATLDSFSLCGHCRIRNNLSADFGEEEEALCMSEEENKALMRRYYEEIDAAAKDERGASVLDELIAPDFVNHATSPGFTPDKEGLKQAYSYFLAAAPDGYHVVEDMIAEGDKVVTRLSAYGTQIGELFGIPPTDKQISMTAIAIHRIANGKIVEHWSELDNLGLMQQLGVVPPPDPPPLEQAGSHPV
jgi:predicted ester cyclase